MADRGILDFIIARLPGLSYAEKIQLCELCNTEDDIVKKSKSDIEIIIKRIITGEKAASWNIDKIRKEAENDSKAAHIRGIHWVSWLSPLYPPLLREIYDPPVLLFYRGKLPNPNVPLVAIVGTRKPSPQAAAQAFDIARGLARSGISVVSGLAVGIDSMAHRGNIEGLTAVSAARADGAAASAEMAASAVAVLGSGVDEVYPSTNRMLARRILETGGVLVSEYAPGTGPRKWTFPARNRIISGLSRGVLIVEAPQRSGALITARFALEQNRELWVASSGIAVGGGIRFDRRGTKKLAEDGAPMIHSAADILKAWNMRVAS
ncbi:MAG: DNA-protecting protein DprA [Treponema sp.]|nr:DNA-protecting protein DprA [Treponema sp.]